MRTLLLPCVACLCLSGQAAQIPPSSKEPAEEAKARVTANEKERENLKKGSVLARPQLNTADHQGDSEDQKQNANRGTDPEWWMIGLTFGLVLVGAGQVWVLSRQTAILEVSLVETRHATELTRESLVLTQRPKLVVRDVQVDRPQRLTNYGGIPGGPQEGTLNGSVLVVNVGTTDAYLIEEHSELVFWGPDEPLLLGESRFLGRTINNVRLPPGMNTRGCDFSTTEGEPILEKLGDIHHGRLNLFLVGWVSYRDQLGNHRRTSYCRKWDRTLKRFVTTSDPDYENAD